MSAAITWEAAAGLFSFIVALGGIWWRWSSAIQKVENDLRDYKLHVAETYVTKQGQREQTQAMLEAIHSVRTDIKSLNERIDRLFENPPKRTRSTS